MKPVRVQLSRAKGWRMPPNAVKVDRTTVFGNPFFICAGTMHGGGKPPETGYFVDGSLHLFKTREEAQRASVATFADWMRQWPQHKLLTAAQHALHGKSLACWCKLPKPGEPDLCHAAVLLRLVNDGAP